MAAEVQKPDVQKVDAIVDRVSASFGEELKRRRKLRFSAAEEFAKQLGVSGMEVSRWEREEVRGNTVSFPEEAYQLRRISELLEWPLIEIQAAVTQTRRRHLAESPDRRLRDHGLLYAAGWERLDESARGAVLAVVEQLTEGRK